ncbi:leucine-rich repeat domain-containing protein [Enterococcus faecalis]|uniref:leucine-rich repeat domain-containing protein n=1 Tax=Enterococcus faecalis TaxID=1351 RepID=UPI0013693685|nr:hypothetical protein [Enterococcus faecalis]NAA54074.1 hypothetical protein [Enterococcus faecalis]
MKKSIPVLLTTATILGGVLLTNPVQANEITDVTTSNSVQEKQPDRSEVVEFKDPTIKTGASFALMSILGHFPAEEEYTKENLEKITSLFTPNGSMYPTSLDDFKHMPNLEFIDIRYFAPGRKNLDPSAIGQLKNLKEFQFNTTMESDGGGLTSLLPFKENKKLVTFGYYGNPITDASDNSLDNITSLENLEYTIINNNTEINIGSLNNLPNLKTIKLNDLNLTTTPALKQSTKLISMDLGYNAIEKLPDLSLFSDLKNLTYKFNVLTDISNIKTVSRSLESLDLNKNKLTDSVILNIDDSFKNLNTINLSVNNLNQIPDFSFLEKLKDLDISHNNIGKYDNLEKMNEMETPPSVNLQRNILTNDPSIIDYKGNLNTSYNFIAGYGLSNQITLKNINNQTMSIGNTSRLPIVFEWENGHGTDLFLSDFQKAFIDTKNMTITTDNDNVLIEKISQNSIKLIGKSVGTTKVTLSYADNLKTEFEVSVK